MGKNADRDVVYLINHIGSETFVDYFEFFAKNISVRKNKIFFDEFQKRGENWSDNKQRTNASNWKRIFKQKKEIEALHHIANNKHLNKEIREKANMLLEKLEYIVPDEISIENSKNLIEGAKKTIIVNAYERNLDARNKCIEYYGYKCSACTRSFEEMYGIIGKEYIHVHHIKPLSEVKEEYKVNPINDLRPVCPNCHAMLHKANITIDELKKKLEDNVN